MKTIGIAVILVILLFSAIHASAHLASEQAPSINWAMSDRSSFPLHQGHDSDVYRCDKSVVSVELRDTPVVLSVTCKDGKIVIKTYKDFLEYLIQR